MKSLVQHELVHIFLQNLKRLKIIIERKILVENINSHAVGRDL